MLSMLSTTTGAGKRTLLHAVVDPHGHPLDVEDLGQVDRGRAKGSGNRGRWPRRKGRP